MLQSRQSNQFFFHFIPSSFIVFCFILFAIDKAETVKRSFNLSSLNCANKIMKMVYFCSCIVLDTNMCIDARFVSTMHTNIYALVNQTKNEFKRLLELNEDAQHWEWW